VEVILHSGGKLVQSKGNEYQGNLEENFVSIVKVISISEYERVPLIGQI
jgi:hypothetical protein